MSIPLVLPSPFYKGASWGGEKRLAHYLGQQVAVSESVNHSVMSDSVTPQASLSMEFFKQEYWRGEPFPSPGNLPDPGIETGSLALSSRFLPSEPTGSPTGGGASCKFRSAKH